MPTIRRDDKLICFKIVYCGAALSGKTTNISQIHQRLGADSSLVTMNNGADRTLFFDFLALELDLLPGYRTLLQLYTVPGQTMYNATMNLVLKEADGVVFVVDSQADRQRDNLQAWQNLEAGLKINHIQLSTLPLVLQYNKRDLPNIAPVDYLEYLFNNSASRRMGLEAQAAGGNNVVATLNAIVQGVLLDFQEKTSSQMANEPENYLDQANTAPAVLPERNPELMSIV